MYKDKDKQRVAAREAMRRKRAKGITKGITGQGITSGPIVIPARYITDATGARHKVDYEGRRKSYAVLKAWAEGKGTAWQQALGKLGLHYNMLKGINVQQYLGHI